MTMDAFFTSSGILALITLTFLEIVLGVDNVIFISILSSKLPASQQGPARRMGLLAAMGMRILLLLCVVRRHGRRNHHYGYSRDPSRRCDDVISATH